MTCPISDAAMARHPVDFGRFQVLHPDGRNLILGWLERAAAGPEGDDGFEPFIFLWIAVNGWAACVTEKDDDRDWVRAIGADPTLNDRFVELIDRPTRTAEAARRFHELWPIFRVAELRRLELAWPAPEDRRVAVEAYLEGGARLFAPSCFRQHLDAEEEVPLDWGHCLAALYRVRCNLFHGEKARDSENDRSIVDAAYRTLLAFIEEAEPLALA